MKWMRYGLSATVLITGFALNAQSQTAGPNLAPSGSEAAPAGPPDLGLGAGVQPNAQTQAAGIVATPLAAAAAVSQAQTTGAFSGVFSWPINGIHAVLLPNGRVLSYGTDQRGQQGGQFVYDVWNPTQGTGTLAHTVLPNTTATDIFCSGQSIIRSTGKVLITGGDLTVGGTRNYSNDRTTIFSPQTNTISSGSPMMYPRWYPSVIPLTNGEMLILGGRDAPGSGVPTPEVYNPSTGWRTLWNAASDLAYGNDPLRAWYYPKAWQAPNGQVFVWGHDGNLFYLSPPGNGALTQLVQKTVPSWNNKPGLMYAPGKVMSMRNSGKVVTIDLNGTPPVVTEVAPLSQPRAWSSATVLPDGKVLVTGGSGADNQLVNVAYHAEIWDPGNPGQWTRGASAAKARLYHSTALLLPDGTVLTMGGGAPGPVSNLNGEIYSPPYLFKKDGSGLPAPRPTIVSAPATARVGQPLVATIGSTAPIGRVTMVRAGTPTHSFDGDQRFLPLTFTQSGQTVAATIPANPNIALPGYYLLFVLDPAGVPSLAKFVQVVL